jgi:hypothetical protein
MKYEVWYDVNKYSSHVFSTSSNKISNHMFLFIILFHIK